MADPTVYIEQTIRSVTDAARLVEDLGPVRAATLHDGLPGTALLLAALSRTDRHLAAAAASQWDTAAKLLTHTQPAGIYSGSGALATSLILGSGYLPDSASQHAAVTHATAWLSARAQGLAQAQTQRHRDSRPGTPWAIYDAIQGLAGIGRILLAADQAGQRTPAAPGLTAALTTLTTMINAPARPHPGWWAPAPSHAPQPVQPQPLCGAATTGIAHGIAGPLAFIAAAHTAARTVPGQTTAIRTASQWLLTWRNPGGTWPDHIPSHALDQGPQPAAGPGRRDSWCYGNTGIGHALILAATALHDTDLYQHGTAALDTVAARPPDNWDTTGPGLCHGTAGVLLTALQHGHTALSRAAEDHTLRLSNQAFSKNPGMLTGTVGTALALADATSMLNHPYGAPWHVLLLTGTQSTTTLARSKALGA